jgi:hypothetical protein
MNIRRNFTSDIPGLFPIRYLTRFGTEQASVAVELHIYFWQCVFGSNVGHETRYLLTDICCSLPGNFGVLFRLGYNRFLPNTFQFSVHPSSYHLALYNLRRWQRHIREFHRIFCKFQSLTIVEASCAGTRHGWCVLQKDTMRNHGHFTGTEVQAK